MLHEINTVDFVDDKLSNLTEAHWFCSYRSSWSFMCIFYFCHALSQVYEFRIMFLTFRLLDWKPLDKQIRQPADGSWQLGRLAALAVNI